MKSFHIAAYVYAADISCCDCIAKWAEDELLKEQYTVGDIEKIIRENPPSYDTGVFAYRSTILLEELADIWNVNLEDEYSYDSDNFPKVVFADQIEDPENCGICHERIP